jgi:hypothetical protein
MITNFKIFEQNKYNVGDYILMECDYHEKKYYNVRIIEVRTKKYYFKYIVEDDDDEKYAINEVDIVRKLTSEEIEKWNINRDINKYNL